MYEPRYKEPVSEDELKLAIGGAVLGVFRVMGRVLKPVLWIVGVVFLVVTIASWVVGASWLLQAVASISDWSWNWTGAGPTGP